jgi:hypothetical protein
MVRRFVTLDGEITAEEEWDLNPTNTCFYCNQYLIGLHQPCPIGFLGQHEFVTLIDPV